MFACLKIENGLIESEGENIDHMFVYFDKRAQKAPILSSLSNSQSKNHLPLGFYSNCYTTIRSSATFSIRQNVDVKPKI